MSLKERIKNRLALLFPEPLDLDPELEKESDKGAERKLVTLYAQGNVSLRQGSYITSKDIKQKRSELLLHHYMPAK